jgi:hypothetical protein
MSAMVRFDQYNRIAKPGVTVGPGAGGTDAFGHRSNTDQKVPSRTFGMVVVAGTTSIGDASNQYEYCVQNEPSFRLEI